MRIRRLVEVVSAENRGRGGDDGIACCRLNGEGKGTSTVRESLALTGAGPGGRPDPTRIRNEDIAVAMGRKKDEEKVVLGSPSGRFSATAGSPMAPAGIQTKPPFVVAVSEYFRNHIVIIVFPTRRRVISFNFTDGVYIRQTKVAPFKLLVPLIYAPILPLSKACVIKKNLSNSWMKILLILSFFFLFCSTYIKAPASIEGSIIHSSFGWGICSWILLGVSFSLFFYKLSLLDKNIIFENTIDSNKGMCLSITM
ncbi:hypothetical protein LXL04_003959 [Taraxacum kok-saghyz]